MSDIAKGPAGGYIFQLEKALLHLASLENDTDYVSIEDVDDVASHSEDGTVLISVQAKHSISRSGSTFSDTSYALWRTIELWITKLKSRILTPDTKFVCSTNKLIPVDSFLSKISKSTIEELNIELASLYDKQKKSKKKQSKKESTKKEIHELIAFAISNKSEFEIIKNNLEIDVTENLKSSFLSKILIGDNYNIIQKDAIYHEFFGWITSTCRARWNNEQDAYFTKKQLDNKLFHIHSNSTITCAVFRTKELLNPEISESSYNEKKSELFVKQIEELNVNKPGKELRIKNAIQDFLLSEIELSYIIKQGIYTQDDFDEFIDVAYKYWEQLFYENVINEIDSYTEDEKNRIAITIFDLAMKSDIKFKNMVSFNTSNKYFKNGQLLSLSNIPKIGWHPDWANKYNIQ